MGIAIQTDPGAWDRFIGESPYGSVFHRWDACRIVEKHTGFRFLPYGITKGEELIALLPLFFRRIHGIRVVGSPPPRTGIPRLGVVVAGSFDSLKQYRKEQYLEIIGTSLEEELRSLDPDHFLMSLPPGFHDVRIFQWLGFHVEPWFTYVYDLSRPLEEIWAGFKSSKRNRIRMAEQNGYTLRRGTGVRELYKLMELRAREVGQSLALPGAAYLEDLFRSLPDSFRVYEVCQEGQVIGSVMTALDRNMGMWQGAPKTVPHANDFLHWALIREAKEQNFPKVEDMGANTRHLTQFKNQFNPSLMLYYTIARNTFPGRMAKDLYCLLHKRGSR